MDKESRLEMLQMGGWVLYTKESPLQTKEFEKMVADGGSTDVAAATVQNGEQGNFLVSLGHTNLMKSSFIFYPAL